MSTNAIKAIQLTSIAASTFDGTYKAVNATGLGEACSMIRIMNKTNKDVTISYDGVVDHDFLLVDDTLELSFSNNASTERFTAKLKKGTKVYVKAATGTGTLYLSGYYN